MKFHEIALHEISDRDFCTSIRYGVPACGARPESEPHGVCVRGWGAHEQTLWVRRAPSPRTRFGVPWASCGREMVSLKT